MKDEPASRGLPGVDPLTDPGVRKPQLTSAGGVR